MGQRSPRLTSAAEITPATTHSSLHEPSISTPPPRAPRRAHSTAEQRLRQTNGPYRFRRRISTLFLAAAAALAPARPPPPFHEAPPSPSSRATTSKRTRSHSCITTEPAARNEEDVEPFLYNLFADPDIIRLPPALAVYRRPSHGSQRREEPQVAGGRIDRGGCPSSSTRRSRLDCSSLDCPDYNAVAMRYWHPFTDDAVQKPWPTAARRPSPPLYPHFSISTTVRAAPLILPPRSRPTAPARDR